MLDLLDRGLLAETTDEDLLGLQSPVGSSGNCRGCLAMAAGRVARVPAGRRRRLLGRVAGRRVLGVDLLPVEHVARDLEDLVHADRVLERDETEASAPLFLFWHAGEARLL